MRDDLDDLFSGLERVSAPERPQPFKFLDPYGLEDRAIFFGRESETAMLYAQFYKSRLTLVYGESGTGKTSLIDCGLRAQIPPEDMLFIPVRTALDPETALRQEVLKQVPLADGAPEELEALLREAIGRKHKTLVLVFDQFEEFFLFQPASVRAAFTRQVAAWLEHGLDLRLLIGIREEYLARLTELEEYLPGLYQNRLWVRRMSREQAQEAITGPCRTLGIALEPELVAELLDTLTSGGQGVELPILQVVLDMLYRRAVVDNPEHPRLTRAGYQALGQAQSILARFIEDQVSAYGDEAEPARQLLKTLVTAEGTRRLSSPAEIQERLLQFGSEVSEEQLMRRLRRLVDDRIVREDADHHLFELRHDALAARIRQWMTGIEQELIEVRQTLEDRLREYRQRGRLLDADVLAYLAPYESRLHLRGELAELVAKSKQEAARRRRSLVLWSLASITGILLVVSGLALSAYLSYREAERNLRDAVGRQLAAQSERLLAGGDPALATLLAVEASRRLTSLETDQALRHALRVLPRNKVIVRRNTKIRSMAISPDGHWLAESGEDGVLAIHDAKSGELTLTEKLGTMVDALAFDPASRHLGAGGADGSVLVLNMTQPSARVVKKFEGAVTAIAFDPPGTMAAIATAKTKLVLARSADLTEQNRLDARGMVPAEALAFSPDGKWLAAGSSDGYLYVWEARTGREHLRPAVAASGEPEQIGVNALQFSADSKTVAVAGNGRAAILFDIASGRSLTTVKHNALVSSVAISPDGRYLGTGSIDETARIWELPSGRLLAFVRQNGPVSRVMFSPDGRFMITAGRDGTARSLTVPAGRELARISHLDRVSAIAYDAQNARFASAGWDGSVILAELEAREEVGRLIHQSVIFDVHVSHDGKWLAAAGKDKTVSVWSFDSRREVARLSLPVGCFALDFSPDSRWLAAGCGQVRGGSGILRVWSTDDWHEVASVSLPNAGLLTRFSPDGKWLAVGAGQAVGKGPGAAVVVSTDSWRTVAQLPYVESCSGVAFSADQQWLAAGCGHVGGGSPGEVSVYSTGKWQRVVQFPQKDTVIAVTFSPNSRWLAMAGGPVKEGKGEVLLWETGTWREAARLKHSYSVFDAQFSADSKMLATGSGNSLFGDSRGESALWHIPSGILIRKFPTRMVGSINFSPHGGSLATAGLDPSVRVWDSVTGRQIAEMAQDDALMMAAYHPTGRYLVSGGWDGTARVWMIRPADLAAEACSRLWRNMTKEEWAAYLQSEPYGKTCVNLP